MDINPQNMADAINNARAREQREQAKVDAERRVRYMQQRRHDARSRGYRGPLTRDEAARAALRRFVD